MLPPSGGGPGRTLKPGGPAPAWKNWLLPSDRRLSPARPGKPRWSWWRTFWLSLSGSSGFGTSSWVNGTSTLFVQAESARPSSRNGIAVLLNATTSGIVWRSTRAVPRSSRSDISSRAWRMKGIAASSVSSEERTPGSASRAKARSVGKAALSEASAGCAWRRRVAQRGHGGGQRRVLAGERAGGDVEVRDQVLQRALVVVERREGLLLAVEHALQVAVGIDAERGVVGERRVAVGGLPVVDRPG